MGDSVAHEGERQGASGAAQRGVPAAANSEELNQAPAREMAPPSSDEFALRGKAVGRLALEAEELCRAVDSLDSELEETR
jgi:hypothetical protein